MFDQKIHVGSLRLVKQQRDMFNPRSGGSIQCYKYKFKRPNLLSSGCAEVGRLLGSTATTDTILEPNLGFSDIELLKNST